jgi:hypothetical protein
MVYMTVILGNHFFVMPAGATWDFTTAINGQTTTGGDYKGPLVSAAFVTNVGQSAAITPTNPRYIGEDQSRVVYDYSVHNPNSDTIVFAIDKFFNG